MESESMIQMYNVYMKYKRDITVLQDISFLVEKGEFIFITGLSGAGKSTILRLLYRELLPTKGEIVVAGYNLAKIRNSQLPYFRRKVGVVFQDFKLLPNKTVEQNIAFSMRVTGAKKSQIKKNVDRILDWTNLTHRRNAFPEDISGGEQQRTSIARAVVNDPIIVLADEPTGNLDPGLSMEIMRLFERLSMRGTTVIVATHNTNIVKAFDKRVVKIEHGKIVED